MRHSSRLRLKKVPSYYETQKFPRAEAATNIYNEADRTCRSTTDAQKGMRDSGYVGEEDEVSEQEESDIELDTGDEDNSDYDDLSNADDNAHDDFQNEDDDYEDVDSLLLPKKRKRSSSPSLGIPVDRHSTSPTLTDDEAEEEEKDDSKPITVQFSITIPAGHKEPIVLHLKPSGDDASVSLPAPKSRPARTKKKQCLGLSKWAGFLDLPAELRNQVYRLVFVAEKPLDFSEPSNFGLSAAFLRTSRQVYNEGRSILYSENEFHFARRSACYGSLWNCGWKELGFRLVRIFLKLIGPQNTGLIRDIRLHLQDAVPCLNPQMKDMDSRRFIYDDNLMSVLHSLAKHGRLRNLELLFNGRKKVDVSSERFLSNMRRVRADDVTFVPYRSYLRPGSKQAPSVEKMLLASCTRRRKLFGDSHSGMRKGKPGSESDDDDDYDDDD